MLQLFDKNHSLINFKKHKNILAGIIKAKSH